MLLLIKSIDTIFTFVQARMYTDTIHDMFIKDNHIIDGPSFQFRDNNG